MEFVLGGYLGEVIDQTEKFLIQSAGETSKQVSLDKELLRQLMLGGLASVHTLMMVVSLFLARSWQAGLFNPGGFQKEFHALRLPVPYTGALLAIALVCYQLDLELMRWLPLLLLPWIFAGVALVHGSLAKRDLGKPWLIGFYCSTLFMGQFVISLLVFVAVIDSLVDFRSRIPAKN